MRNVGSFYSILRERHTLLSYKAMGSPRGKPHQNDGLILEGENIAVLPEHLLSA